LAENGLPLSEELFQRVITISAFPAPGIVRKLPKFAPLHLEDEDTAGGTED
jgi:hypothetical protein